MISALTFRTSTSRQATAIAMGQNARLVGSPRIVAGRGLHTQVRPLLNVTEFLDKHHQPCNPATATDGGAVYLGNANDRLIHDAFGRYAEYANEFKAWLDVGFDAFVKSCSEQFMQTG